MPYTKSTFARYSLILVPILFLMFTSACGHSNLNSQGRQDGYILSLLWWPDYCQSHRELQACAGADFHGFAAGGLLPRLSSRWQQADCGVKPGPRDTTKLLKLIPDRSLIQEIWQQYGFCSGLTADDYFALVKDAFSSTRIPDKFVDPKDSFVISPKDLKLSFVKLNAGLLEDDITVSCNEANLREVRICMSKQLHFMSCPALPDCQRSVVYVTARMPLAE
jgi:ribonuclease T2